MRNPIYRLLSCWQEKMVDVREFWEITKECQPCGVSKKSLNHDHGLIFLTDFFLLLLLLENSIWSSDC